MRGLLTYITAVAFAGHAGEMDTPGVMPHELVAGLVGLAAILLLTILALTWVIWRLRDQPFERGSDGMADSPEFENQTRGMKE